MKFIFFFVLVAAIGITILVIKNKNISKIDANGKTTNGIVVEEFNRGKLPFCKFSYDIDGITYTKKQEVPKNLSGKILNKTYIVKYEIANPKNAILQFSKKGS